MIDIKDIVPAVCEECLKGIKNVHMIMNNHIVFCSYECAQQFVINHNADYAERKAEER